MSVIYVVQGEGAYVAFGLSTDPKPVNPSTNSQCIEIDTGSTYRASGNAWSAVVDMVNQQTRLVLGTTIKTINGPSILGSGNIAISGSGTAWGEITGTLANQTDLQTALNTKANTASLGTLATQNGTFSGTSTVYINSYIRAIKIG